MRYAQLQNNVIVQIIESETDPDGINGEWVESGTAGVGYTLVGGVFVAPTPVAQPRIITTLAFRNRFTSAEKVAIEIAALDNPAAPMPARAQAAALRANQADLAAAAFVDLDRPDTRAGVQMLETAGLLAAGRALAILDAPIQPEERPL